MTKENFKFLFKRYKLNQLSGKELRDWQRVISSDDYKPFIESDIDVHMLEFLFYEIATIQAILHRIHRKR